MGTSEGITDHIFFIFFSFFFFLELIDFRLFILPYMVYISCFYPSDNNAFILEQSLIPCTNVHERNLLAETARIVEKNKVCKRKDNLARQVVTNGLLALGYDASICKSHWEKSPTHPAGIFLNHSCCY